VGETAESAAFKINGINATVVSFTYNGTTYYCGKAATSAITYPITDGVPPYQLGSYSTHDAVTLATDLLNYYYSA
jgi:hypothetical protein